MNNSDYKIPSRGNKHSKFEKIEYEIPDHIIYNVDNQ